MRGAITKRAAPSAWLRRARPMVSISLKPTGASALTPAPVSPQRIRVSGHVKAGKFHCRSARPVGQPTERTMNVLSFPKQVQIISALTEGCSIRSAERLTETHRDTVMRLMVRVGRGCEGLHDGLM